MTVHDSSGTDHLQGKNVFGLLRVALGLSLGECSIRPLDKPHSTSESTPLLLPLLLYQIIDLRSNSGACILKELKYSKGRDGFSIGGGQ